MKTSISSVLLLTFVVLLSACGGSKKATADGRKELETNRCEQMALEQSGKSLRAYGVATSKNKSFARDNAVLTARRELGGIIEASISGLFTRYRKEYTTNNEQDFSEKAEQGVKEVVDQIIPYATVICSSSYELANGTIETHVCIEIQSEWQQAIIDKAKKEAQNGIDINADTMKKDLDDEVNKLRERRNQ